MYRLPSKTRFRRATFGLALALLVWVGGLVPIGGLTCSHEKAEHGVAHASQWCLWSCAEGPFDVVHAAQDAVERFPESGVAEAPGSSSRCVSHAGQVLSRGPPVATVQAE